ncbi:unnamed protein product [Rotaria sp. Silwood1]|nr:unnamed protein product [Rotaria sp. Silwood1]
MGPHYLHTFGYNYLAPPQSHRRINLKRQSIIIDANSFMYFIYDQILNEAERDNRNHDSTNTLFDYNGYWDYLREVLIKFKNNCSSVLVVFDGVYKKNANRRPDPQRTSSSRYVEFNNKQNQLPSLFRHVFIDNLREMDIELYVARGEADPMIVQLAQDRGAYIVAADSDYNLYELSMGYVPLKFFNLKRLEGPLYQLKDFFTGMDARDVGLWASLIKYEFVDLKKLQEFLSTNKPHDQNEFESWLHNQSSDEQKHKLITTEWLLVRFIQEVGSASAYRQLIKLVEIDDREKFNQIISSYTNVKPIDEIKTKTKKRLHKYLEERFITGNLDHSILNILINRNVLKSEQENNLAYYQLLLPIIQSLLIWDNEQVELKNDIEKVVFNNQLYEPLKEIKAEDFPSLDKVSKMSEVERKNWLLFCVNSALQLPIDMNENRIDDDHLALIYFLKLWWCKGQEQTLLKQFILDAIIVSYIIHTFLIQCDKSDDSQRITKPKSVSEPFLKHPKRKLKKCFASDTYVTVTQKIKKYLTINVDNENIKTNLVDVEKFYNVLHMVNQFFDLPVNMPKPHECISTLAYRLSIVFSQSKKPIAYIVKSVFDKNCILIGLFNEIKSWIEQIDQSGFVVNENLST